MIITDLTQMIHEYDFSSFFNQAITEEQARQIQWQAEYKPSVEELLAKLQEALKEEAHLEEMWPDARLKDKEMFQHLNLAFDLTEDRVTVETAAKDYHGVPVYQFVYDTDDKTAVEITNFEGDIEEKPIEVVIVPQVEPVAPAAPAAPVAGAASA